MTRRPLYVYFLINMFILLFSVCAANQITPSGIETTLHVYEPQFTNSSVQLYINENDKSYYFATSNSTAYIPFDTPAPLSLLLGVPHRYFFSVHNATDYDTYNWASIYQNNPNPYIFRTEQHLVSHQGLFLNDTIMINQGGEYPVTIEWKDMENPPVRDADRSINLTLCFWTTGYYAIKSDVPPSHVNSTPGFDIHYMLKGYGEITAPLGNVFIASAPFHYDNQAVVRSVPNYYPIQLKSFSCITDYDVKTYYYDQNARAVPVEDSHVSIWWKDADPGNTSGGYFSSYISNNTDWTPGVSVSGSSDDIPISLFFTNNNTPYARDYDIPAPGNKNTVNIRVFASHLDRDIVNFNGLKNHFLILSGTTSDWNCHDLTSHSFMGVKERKEEKWFLNNTTFNILGPFTTNQPLQKFDIVGFSSVYDNPNNTDHSAIATGEGYKVFQANYKINNVGHFFSDTPENILEIHDDQYESYFIWRKK